MAMSYDDDRPVPPVRITSVRGNGPSNAEKDKDKKKGLLPWGSSKKSAGGGECVCVCALAYVRVHE